jgi:peptidoglycan/LPS O-acetylase OafA/YrhL
MPLRPVTILGRTKALYEWVLGLYVIFTGILVLASFVVVGKTALVPMPDAVRNALIVSDLIIGGFLLAVWGEHASTDPKKSAAGGLALIVFACILLTQFALPGLVLGTILVTLGVYLFVHGLLELAVQRK